MIHMHDLQVQNQIVSKNSIEATNKITSKEIEATNKITSTNLTVTGDLTAQSDINVAGCVAATDNITTESDLRVSNKIYTNDIEANNNVNIANDLQVQNKIYANDIEVSNLQASNNVNITNDLQVQNKIYTSDIEVGNLQVNDTINVGNTMINNNILRVLDLYAGDANIDNNAVIGNDLSVQNEITVKQLKISEIPITVNDEKELNLDQFPRIYFSEAQFNGDVSITGELNNGSDVYLHDGDINTIIRERATGQWPITSINSLTAQALSIKDKIGGEDVPVYFKNGVPVVCKQIISVDDIGTIVPDISGDGASGDWNISAYPRIKAIQPDSQSTIVRSVLLEPNLSYDNDTAAYVSQDLQLYQFDDNSVVLRVQDISIGQTADDTLSHKTMNIAGTDVNIWGGTLSTKQLSTNLKRQGIVESSFEDEGKWVKIASKTINAGETSFITCHIRTLEDARGEGIFTAWFTGTYASLIWHSPSLDINTDSIFIRTYLTTDNTLAIGELYCQVGEFPQQYRVLMEDADEQNNDPFWTLFSFTSQDNLPSSNEDISIPANYEDLTTNNEIIQHGISNSIQANRIYATNIHGTADTAMALISTNNKLLTVGNENTPVYFKNGVPIACSNGELYLYNKNDSATLIKAHDRATGSLSFSLPPTSKDYTTSTLLSSSYLVGEYDTTYGEVLPTNPEEGQVFFKINENGTKENETDRGYWITATPYIYKLKNSSTI